MIFFSAFSSFEEAVAEAIKLGDKCGGITRTRLGYSLRVGPSICIDDASRSKNELSWTFNSGDKPTVEDDVYNAETDDDSDNNASDPVEEPKVEPVKEPSPEPVPEDAGGKSDNESDDEEGEDYPAWEYNGTTYYYDEEDNSVMNDDGEVIGTRMAPNKKHSDYWIKFN